MLAKFLRARIAKLSVVAVLTLLAIVSGAWFASMKAATPQATNCAATVPGKIYRYIEGIDTCLSAMSNTDVEKLTDPFAKSILRQGVFPDGTEAIDKAIGEKLGYRATIYMVGEGAQIPATVVSRDNPRGLRYLFAWGANENEGKIMMSKLAPATPSSLIEVMAFDEQTKKYNYYLLGPQVGASYDAPMVWAWNGNSSMAQKPGAMGHGCFRCHHNGVPVMRELEFPWNNWQSQRANIASTIIPTSVATEKFFLPRRNAEIFEGVVRGSVQHYYVDWLNERSRKEGTTTYLTDVEDMLRHLTTTTTINFKSSDVQSRGENTSPPNLDIAGIPPKDTFLSDTLWQTVLGINYTALSVTLPRKDYDAYLKKHNFRLVGTKGFTRESEEAYQYPGATYFAYFVPQVPAEDIYVTQLLLNSKVVTEKFVASLLMVDFKNPLFSEKRASLKKYAKEITTSKVVGGVSSLPTDFVAKIKEKGAKACSANNFDSCSAEEQFLYVWELPDNQWKQVISKQLQAHVDSVANLEPNQRLEFLMRRSVEQGDRFASTPALCEFFEARLFLPETDLSKVPHCQKPAS